MNDKGGSQDRLGHWFPAFEPAPTRQDDAGAEASAAPPAKPANPFDAPTPPPGGGRPGSRTPAPATPPPAGRRPAPRTPPPGPTPPPAGSRGPAPQGQPPRPPQPPQPPHPQAPHPQAPQPQAPAQQAPAPPAPPAAPTRPPAPPAPPAAPTRPPAPPAPPAAPTRPPAPPAPPQFAASATPPAPQPTPKSTPAEFDPFADNSAPPTWLANDGGAPAPAKAPKAPSHRGRNFAIIGGGLVVCAVLIGGLALALVNSGGTKTDSPDTTASDVDAPAAADANWCEPTVEGASETGNRPGGHTTGADVLFGFDYALYVERDGAKVASFGVPGQYDAVELQKAIDAIPQGIEHCTTVTEIAPDTFQKTLVTRQGITTNSYKPAVFKLVNIDGRYFVENSGDA